MQVTAALFPRWPCCGHVHGDWRFHAWLCIQELLLDYGHARCNLDLMCDYGFVTAGNAADRLQLTGADEGWRASRGHVIADRLVLLNSSNCTADKAGVGAPCRGL